MYFLGWVFGVVTILRFGDILGRKRTLIFVLPVLITAMLLLCYVDNQFLAYFLIFVIGCTAGVKSSLFYLYAFELVPTSMRTTMHVIMGINECGVVEAGTPFVIYHIQDTYKYFLYYSFIIFFFY
jgi:MFS family permease